MHGFQYREIFPHAASHSRDSRRAQGSGVYSFSKLRVTTLAFLSYTVAQLAHRVDDFVEQLTV